MEVDKKLFLIKLHYFLFFGALGPILPYLNVIGKQLEISEMVMGTINAILPLAVLVVKPGFGYIIDLFHRQRKLLFMLLIGVMSVGFCMLSVITPRCYAVCPETSAVTLRSNVSLNVTQLPAVSSPSTVAATSSDSSSQSSNESLVDTLSLSPNASLLSKLNSSTTPVECHLECDHDNLYKSSTFWYYVLFTTLGILGFNIVSCTSDAVCFDMLGVGNEVQYGMQRLFGTFGFGLTAMGTGWAIDYFSGDSEIKSYAPSYCLVILFGVLDLLCCAYLRLPRLSQSNSILKDVSKVMKQPYVKSFLAFAGMAGFCEGFVIYNLFWYMEDLAIATGSMHNIKLLQGFTVAVQTMFGEVVVFYYSDRIIDTLGYGHCLTFCFFAYFLRLGLIALAPSPWWLLPIELFAQGPSYALSYTCVVAYASAIAPPGTSATMQGVMAGVNDGFGYSIASFVGGALYTKIGGQYTFAFFSLTAFVCAIAHAIIYRRAARKLGLSIAQEYQCAVVPEPTHDETRKPAEQMDICEPDDNEKDEDKLHLTYLKFT